MHENRKTRMDNLVKKLQCPRCKSADLGMDEYFICRTCGEKYPICDGIAILIPQKKLRVLNSNNWDTIYKDGLRGDFTRGANKLTNTLRAALNDRKILRTQHPLIALIENAGISNIEVLEIGCGTGAFSLLLKRLGIARAAYLVDISLPALKTAQQIFQNFGEEAYFILADAGALPFKRNSFGLSFSTGLIEHFEGEKQQQIILEQCGVASNIFCQFPTNSAAYWVQRFFITLINKGNWPFGYERPLSLNKAKQLFTDNNCKVADISYHDSIAGIIYKLSYKYKWIKPLRHKVILNKLFMTDFVLYTKKELEA